MSINDFTNKIKDKVDIDTFKIVCLVVIIGVGIGAFGLGRLSVSVDSSKENEEIKIIDTRVLSATANIDQNIPINNTTDTIQKEKRYVASKNGKLYYSLGCSGAKRISEKNMIWFATKTDAEKSGYEFASSCK